MKSNEPYQENELFYILISLLNSLLVLKNEKKIAHCDLKPQNILFIPNPNNPQKYLYKLADFGTSYCCQEGDEPSFPFILFSKMIGYTEGYASPEIIMFLEKRKENPACDFVYDPFKSDVFSLGIIMIELTALKINEISEILADQNFTNLLVSHQQYEKLIPFLENMLIKDPAQRISLDNLKAELQLGEFQKFAQAPNDKFFIKSKKNPNTDSLKNKNNPKEENNLNNIPNFFP